MFQRIRCRRPERHRRAQGSPASEARGIRPAILLVIAALLAITHPAAATIRIVASVNDLASIAAEVGGDRVEVQSIARATADVHRVEVLPSYMVRVSKADLYLKVGFGLDQWADQIIDGSRNGRLAILDCGRDITALEKPAGKVDASMGDVHPDGNPHYWLDPRNGAIVARTVAEELGRLDPPGAEQYRRNAEGLAHSAEALLAGAKARVESMPVRAVLSYHSSWVYLADALGLEIAGTVEPVPGIPPTGNHLQKLTEIIRARSVPVLLQEPYFSDQAGKFLQRQTGIRVARVSASCDEATAGSWLRHLEAVIAAVTGGDFGAGDPGEEE